MDSAERTFLTVLFIIICICFFLAIMGFFFSKKEQEDSEIYNIGGANGFLADKFFRKHPQAKKIFDKVDSIMTKSGMQESDMQDLINDGCKVVARGNMSGYAMVITTEMCLLYGRTDHSYSPMGTKGQVFDVKNKESVSKAIKYEHYNVPIGSYEIEKKQKSIVKNAIGGAIIAGGVGAVVGAVNAASKNASSDKVETKLIYGESPYGFWGMKFDGGIIVPIKDMMTSNEYKDYAIEDIGDILRWL